MSVTSPLCFNTTLRSGQSVNVEAAISGDTGEPGSLGVPPTLWINEMVVRNAAGRRYFPSVLEVADLHDEIERRAGLC